MKRICKASLLAFGLTLGLPAGPALAASGGISGYSGNPATNRGKICSHCHSGGQTPIVVLFGPTTVKAGSTNHYMLRIAGGQEIAGGLDVSVTNGTLTNVDAGTWVQVGELTHAGPRPADASGSVAFPFDWTAPLHGGTVTMYAAGNSVNLSGTNFGDAPNSDTLVISVDGRPSTPGETSGAGLPPMIVTDYNRFTGILFISYEPGCVAVDHNIYFGPLSGVSSYAYSGEICNVGADGTTPVPLPAGSFFFVIVGDDGTLEGSYGRDSALQERPAAETCGLIQDLSASCDEP